MKQKQRNKRKKQQAKTRKQNKTKKKERKERKKNKRETEKERVKKGEEKKTKVKQRETLKNVQNAFFRRKTFSFLLKANKPNKKKNAKPKTKAQKNKEGLGPSEVARRATSPDP